MDRLFSKKNILSLCLGAVLFAMSLTSAHAVFINEIHYDNRGRDVGEGVELTGVAGQNLAGWSLLFYNGGNGSVYKNYALSGVFSDMQQGMGVLSFAISGIQNGDADGMALVNTAGSILQFLSYEGSFTASAGLASSLTSIDIGITESGSTPVGDSLQLMGNGRDSAGFSWGIAAASFGEINMSQSFAAPVRLGVTPVPEPASGVLLLLGLLLIAIQYRAKNNTGTTVAG